jgi:hypothetical protein
MLHKNHFWARTLRSKPLSKDQRDHLATESKLAATKATLNCRYTLIFCDAMKISAIQ